MRIQLGLENFLTEEQKHLLLDLKEVLQDGTRSPEVYSEVNEICRNFTLSVISSNLELEKARPGWEDARSEQHENAESMDENKSETEDETNIIHLSCQNREE